MAGYQLHKTQKGAFAIFRRYLYIIFNGQLIFPLQGLIVSMTLIFIFIFTD